jgi:hypothetical protein
MRVRNGLNRTLCLLAVAILASALGGRVFVNPADASIKPLHAAYVEPVNAHPNQRLARRLDPATIHRLAQSPTSEPTSTDTPADHPSGTSSPAADVRSALVAQTEVSWEGDWKYDASSSGDEQVALSWIDSNTGQIAALTYSERTDASFDSADAALDDLVSAFLEDDNVTDVVAAGSGALENGSVWRAYTFHLMGIPLTLLMAVSETTDGRYVISTLAGNTESFQASIERAQQEIRLNGDQVFLQGLDGELVSRGSEE